MKKLQGLSRKQLALLAEIVKGDEEGFADLDQILERLPYRTTKQSLQFSIRSLIERGLVEKKEPELRRGRMRRVLGPTSRGLEIIRMRVGKAVENPDLGVDPAPESSSCL